MRRRNWPLLALGVTVAAAVAKKAKKRVRRSVEAYTEAVASGAKPIEGVGTAVAAFVGLAAGPPSPPTPPPR